MSLYRHGKEKWWYEFYFQGQRIRKNSGTLDRDLAKLIEAEHRRSLERGDCSAPSSGPKGERRQARTAISNREVDKPSVAGSEAAECLANPSNDAPIELGPTIEETGTETNPQVIAFPGSSVSQTSMLPHQVLPPANSTIGSNAIRIKVFNPAAIPAPPVHSWQISPAMTFGTASRVFLEWLDGPMSRDRSCYVSSNTMKGHMHEVKALNKFFRDLSLCNIHIDHFREYQRMRSANEGNLWARPAGANKVNAELGTLKRIMKLGDCYRSDIERFYLPLKAEELEIPKALSPAEQEHYLEVAASKPVWAELYYYALIALHTSFSSDEMRTLQQGDINLNYQILAVNRHAGKNKYRRREVPLTDSQCLWALDRALKRSIELVGKSPENYLFPFRRAPHHYIGTEHVSENGMRRKHEEVRAIAGVPWFQLNGWRHTAITRMAEAAVPIATIMARAGHCGARMTAHYTHISQQAERLAMQKMSAARHYAAREEKIKRSATTPAPQQDMLQSLPPSLHMPSQTPSGPRVAAKAGQPSPSPQTAAVGQIPPRREAFSLQGWTGNGFYFGSST